MISLKCHTNDVCKFWDQSEKYFATIFFGEVREQLFPLKMRNSHNSLLVYKINQEGTLQTSNFWISKRADFDFFFAKKPFRPHWRYGLLLLTTCTSSKYKKIIEADFWVSFSIFRTNLLKLRENDKTPSISPMYFLKESFGKSFGKFRNFQKKNRIFFDQKKSAKKNQKIFFLKKSKIYTLE